MRLKKIVCMFLFGALTMGIGMPGFSMYVGNTSDKSFDEPGAGDGSGDLLKSTDPDSQVTIEYLIIKSATYFLKGKAHADWLASKLEAAEHDGVDYYELQRTVNDALNYMRIARYFYRALNEKAENTPYNESVIYQLIVFDYKTFSKERGLNSDIFDRLKDYLEEGNVRGAYSKLLDYTEKIVDELEHIQEDLYCWRFPKEESIWRLNQECAQMLLFGQYMAQVFYKIN